MSYLAEMVGRADAKADRLIHRLAVMSNVSDAARDPDVAPLLPGYAFAERLMSGLTPIERNGLLDFAIERPRGLPGWTLLLTVRGQGELLDRPAAVTIEEGDVVLIPPYAAHHYRRQTASAAWWHRWVYFQPRQTWLPWLSWSSSGAKASILRRQDEDFHRELERIFSEVDAWSISTDPFAAEMSFNLLERAILICDRYRDKPVADYDPRLAEICAYISENIDKPLDLGSIAKHARLSASRLSHIFQQRYGCSIIGWRDDLRMQIACRILRMTDAPIKQVAFRVGYSNPLYFSKMFKRHIGLSPRDYRVSGTGAHEQLDHE